MLQINESVSVDLLSNHITGKVYPWVVSWRGRRYTITKGNLSIHDVRKNGSQPTTKLRMVLAVVRAQPVDVCQI